MLHKIMKYLRKPALYETGTMKLWEDEHISQGMLQAHLDPDWDSATRRHDFVRSSVWWISQRAPAERYPSLLDLGCGPGIYAECFHNAGYRVTGLDISERSVRYARDSAQKQNLPVTYRRCDYLTLEDREAYDLATLINYDFGVLSPEQRALLLQKIHTALHPGGLLILDVFTPRQYDVRREETTGWECAEASFFCAEPHVRLEAFYVYGPQRVYCSRHVILTERSAESLNIWEHTFTRDELDRELRGAGFSDTDWYGDIAGQPCRDDSKELCVVARKGC